MAIYIRDAATEKSVRELAACTGEGVTAAIRKAVEERLQRVRQGSGAGSLADDLMAIGAHCAALPDYNPQAADELLGFDEHGLPS